VNALKFIHTSDWHIGRLFHNVSLLDEQLHALQQVKQYAQNHNIDALVVAGDIFDRSVPPAEAIHALNQFLDEMTHELKIPIIMISGNHDSAKRLGFGANHMKGSNLHILSDLHNIEKPVVIQTKKGEIHFFGIPYHDPVEVAEAFKCDVKTFDEANRYLIERITKVRNPNIPTVLISHCFIDNADSSDSERALSIGGVDRVSFQPLESFDYVALGHLHSPQHKGAKHIRYSGSLLKYSFSEHQQKKGVTLVQFNNAGFVDSQHLTLKPKRDLRILEGTLLDLLEQGKTDPNNDDFLLIRLADAHDLLEPMRQLQKVYPNALQLERPNFAVSNGSQLVFNTDNKRTEEQTFSDFFTQVMNKELTEAQNNFLLSIVNRARAAEERSS
jgi:exonuclease SbcD